MNLLQRSSQTLKAAELIKFGFKTNIVVQNTGLSSNLIRILYKEVQGESPKAGQLPSPASILSTRHSLAHASILITSYIEINENQLIRTVDINRLVEAYKSYCERLNKINSIDHSKKLTVNESWVLVRGLMSKLISIHQCQCGEKYLTTPKQRTLPVCPFCKHDQN